jgi:prepilin-type N-terminal cleavage/methylation domain-containing protein
MKKQMSARKTRRGFSLTELAIVMGVVGMITGGIWWASSNAQELQRDNAGVSEMQETAQNIITMMSGRTINACPGDLDAAGGGITSCMIAAQAIPSNDTYLGSKKLASNPWLPKAGFKIYKMSAKTFRLSFYGLSYKGCIALLTQMTACQNNQQGCPTNVIVQSGGVSQLPDATSGWALTMTSAKAQALCGSNTTAANSTEFDFSL